MLNIKEEAIERMKLLQLHQNVIDEFTRENKLNKSETRYGILYWLDEEEQKLVDEFQNQNEGTLVYHVIKTHTLDFGIVYDLLFITENEDEWEAQREELKDDLVLSHTITCFPESGIIQIKKINGGLVRMY